MKMILLHPSSVPCFPPKAKLLLPTLVVVVVVLMMATTVAAFPVALPGCPEACGSVTVPFPFGFRQGCFQASFNLTCDETHHPPKLFLSQGVEVEAISLVEATMRVRSKIVRGSGSGFNLTVIDGVLPSGGNTSTGDRLRLAVSVHRNVFVAIGCDFLAYLVEVGGDSKHTYPPLSACAALCNDIGVDFIPWWGRDGHVPVPGSTSCSGVGCCQMTMAMGWTSNPSGISYGVELMARNGALDNYPGARGPVGAAFIVDREWFGFSGNVGVIKNITFNHLYVPGPNPMPVPVVTVPTVLGWRLQAQGDHDLVHRTSSTGWRCNSFNSFANLGEEKACNCSKGYQGNPYIFHGCQDIDECQQSVNPCFHGTCTNMPGTYRCSAKKSIISLPGLITIIAISTGFGLLFSLLGVARITNKLKQRRAKKLRLKFFKKNHGLLLQQLISSNKDIAERTRIFSLEELEQSTNKFDNNLILGGGGHGTVYKGILSDQRIVAIKKAKTIVQKEIDQFINEVVILSQTNHRNVVNLFGCCLETEVPLLVYEFISNGTLSFHLHGQSENPLSWKDRLRIALETAKAIAYLHSAASISVYHRDIKCANILLTDTLTSKVSDFGASRSIAIDETGISTAVQGTYGYLDPEYYYTGRLTEKSDVYSFGVILAELLTRVTPVFSSHSSEVTGLASHFVSLIRDNRFLDIVDTQIVEEGGAEDAVVVARLAEACLSLKGEERPTMRQVETTLENVQNSMVKLSSQTTGVNQNAIRDRSYKGSKGGEGTRLYSLEREFIQSSEIPR